MNDAHCVVVAGNYCEKIGHQLVLKMDSSGYICCKCGLYLEEIRKPLSSFGKVNP